MKRLISVTNSLLLTFGLVFMPVSVLALPSNAQADLPLQAGTYNVPGHSELKLHVSVYHAKNNGKPTPSPTPAPKCVVVPDPTSSTPDGTTGWKLPAGDWKYYVNAGSVPGTITAGEVVNLTDQSFDAWINSTEVSTSGGVNLTPGGNTSIGRSQLDGKNVITWGRTSGTALATTYTWYNTTTKTVVENDTVMNQKFSWEWADQTQTATKGCAYENYYDAQNILTHELGHWLGLDDNYVSDYTDNTMYGYGSKTEIKKNTPEAGDIATVNNLY